MYICLTVLQSGPRDGSLPHFVPGLGGSLAAVWWVSGQLPWFVVTRGGGVLGGEVILGGTLACMNNTEWNNHSDKNSTELSQIEHRCIRGRRAINCNCPRHTSAVLLISSFANWITDGSACTVHICLNDVTYKSADWLLDSFVIDSARTINWQKRVQNLARTKRCGGLCMHRSIFYQITVPESICRWCESSLIALLERFTTQKHL